jgi:hypothetical protein
VRQEGLSSSHFNLAAHKIAAAELIKVVGDQKRPQAIARACFVHVDLIADV